MSSQADTEQGLVAYKITTRECRRDGDEQQVEEKSWMKTAIFSESQLLMTPSLTQYTGLLVYLTENEHCLYSITKKQIIITISKSVL